MGTTSGLPTPQATVGPRPSLAGGRWLTDWVLWALGDFRSPPCRPLRQPPKRACIVRCSRRRLSSGAACDDSAAKPNTSSVAAQTKGLAAHSKPINGVPSGCPRPNVGAKRSLGAGEEAKQAVSVLMGFDGQSQLIQRACQM